MRFTLGVLAFGGCCALAACSNTTGGGTSTLPGGQLPPLQNPATPAASPTATPGFASGTILVGDGSTQALNSPGDFKVTAAFPQSSASPVMVKYTVSVSGPGGIAAYGEKGSEKKRMFGRHHTQSPALLYVWFSSDKDVTLPGPPTLAFTIPVGALDPFGTDPTIDLAIYDPANENKWMQRVAERLLATPSPTPAVTVRSGNAAALPTATASPSPTPSPSPSPTPTPRPPGAAPPTPALLAVTPRGPVQTLDMRFLPSARTTRLVAKKNLVFALYAEPAPTPTGSAAPSPKANPSPSSTLTSIPTTSVAPAPSASASP